LGRKLPQLRPAVNTAQSGSAFEGTAMEAKKLTTTSSKVKKRKVLNNPYAISINLLSAGFG
jgi:hypothetical protein